MKIARKLAAAAARTLAMYVAAFGILTNVHAEPIALFNGKDLAGFYTFVKDRGRDADPKGVFTVRDGLIRISGEEWGCITSQAEFENYTLVVEFKWGEATHAPRVDAARDSGVLVHSTGEDGGYSGTWMHSIEVQMIEGGTGDLLVVGDESEKFALTAPVVAGTQVFKEGGTPLTIHKGRIDWWGRDLGWKDVKGFRGAKDVEKPRGEWNRLECAAVGSAITVRLNGVVVSRCYDVKPAKGRIQLQSEGAELFVRTIELTPAEE